MNEESLRVLQNGTEEDCLRVLGDFNKKHTQSLSFPNLPKDMKKRLVSAVLSRLNTPGGTGKAVCLEALRIISREKPGLEHLTTDSALKTLAEHAGLLQYAETAEETLPQESMNCDVNVVVEAQKCLCNIVFNSPVGQRTCSVNGCLEGIVQRLKTYKDPDLTHEVKFFDMRLLFLLTALVSETRPRLVHQLHGLTYLIQVLDLLLRTAAGPAAPPLAARQVDLANEVLKILFNLTITIDKNNLDEEEEAHFMRLVSLLHDLLICHTEQKDKREELHSHTINLLVNMPTESYEELLSPMSEADEEAPGAVVEYDGKNMAAVVVILNFLEQRLEYTPKGEMKESLAPVLHCLCEISRASHVIRKFSRTRVLPHLRDEVRRLPEDGETLRNKLVKLFTHPVHEVKDLAADFCFVLCKESVSRFVKYTGYGNAAGLLAQRGLMCGGRSTVYSSESEESDTEEYLNLRDLVNPITGRWEQDKPSPMEGMTEEQKEHEAMKLVAQINKLQRHGVIQPSRIGADGRPQEVSHVLEMIDSLEPAPRDSDSD